MRALRTTYSEGTVTVEGGLFRSLDAGETWTPTGLNDVGVSGIAADPTDSRNPLRCVLVSGYLETPYSLRRSVDGGLTWSVVLGGFPSGRGLRRWPSAAETP